MRIRARLKSLQIQVLDNETLVYDAQGGGSCHVLNKTAAAVWQLCNGRRTIQELAEALAVQTGLPADPQIVELALVDLRKANLIVEELESSETRSELQSVDRRELIKKLGLGAAASVLLPVVESMLAPVGFATGYAYAAGVTTLAVCVVQTTTATTTTAATTTAKTTTAMISTTKKPR